MVLKLVRSKTNIWLHLGFLCKSEALTALMDGFEEIGPELGVSLVDRQIKLIEAETQAHPSNSVHCPVTVKF